MTLQNTKVFQVAEQALHTFWDTLDHYPDVDPDELIPRYFESKIAQDAMSYIQEWDMPDDVRAGFLVFSKWLDLEHEGHEALLERGRLP